MELKYRKMFFSQIYQHVYPMQKKSETKTHTNKQPGQRFTLQPIVFLRKISDRFRRQSFDAENEAVKIQKRL